GVGPRRHPTQLLEDRLVRRGGGVSAGDRRGAEHGARVRLLGGGARGRSDEAQEADDDTTDVRRRHAALPGRGAPEICRAGAAWGGVVLAHSETEMRLSKIQSHIHEETARMY